MSDFNFDEWASLYKNYPEEFERKRTALLDAEILKAPIGQREKLRMLQMECDAYHHGMTPLAATVAISQLMDSKLNELKSNMESLQSNLDVLAKLIVDPG